MPSRIAIVLSSYPTKQSRIGNAVGLDTPASVITLLQAMRASGYVIDRIPESGDALMSELFPTRLRTTGLSISYSFGVAIFGGFAPFINASLIEMTGSKLAPSFYLMFGAAVSIVALVMVRRTGLR